MVAPDREALRRAFGFDRRRAVGDGSLRALLQRHRERLLRGVVPVELPTGEEVHNGRGTFWCRRETLGLDHRHGAVAFSTVVGADASLARLDPRAGLEHRGVGDCLFLDTETTGLSGGAGTVVFLVGLAFLAGDAVVVEQCFLRDFSEEPAMLQHVATRLGERPVPVSYVGKTFDRHRLHARMTVQGVVAPILTDTHLDLYHVARRAWGRELPDCRLRTVEEHKLGFRRQDDLPGSEAPAAWLQWLRDRTGPVDRVLEHNRLDVLSLVALLGVLAAAQAKGAPD